MSLEVVAEALERVRTVLERRPEMGQHDDAPATARWEHGTRVTSSHANGKHLQTDMPKELGGTGDQVSPGWMFRAGIASCAATTIAMHAAAKGIELTALEVQVGSRSDTRGLMGMPDASGEIVPAGPSEIQIHVRIAAKQATEQELRALVEASGRCSPIPNAVIAATPVAVHVQVEAA